MKDFFTAAFTKNPISRASEIKRIIIRGMAGIRIPLTVRESE
eukprot:CCRYP_020218-RA/>CCRYP_020218-RA protein AED:0.00 eAED:0.00 QI:84/1/1/1/0/0/2/0/41